MHRHVDDSIAKITVTDHEIAIVGERANYRNRATLSFAKHPEFIDAILADDQYVALLRFVAPDAHRRHARLGIVDLAQLNLGAVAAVINGLGYCVRQTTGTDVMDQQDRIVLAHLPAAIDNLLRAALHLRIATLYRSEIQLGAGRAACER